MYGGFSSVVWLEFLKKKKKETHPKMGWVYGFILPSLISGVIELLQEYCTTYRGGEWLDFVANSVGALSASLFIYFFLSSRFRQA